MRPKQLSGTIFCVRKGSWGLARCSLFEVPSDYICEFKPVKLTKKTTCFLDKRLHDLFDLQLLRLASGKHLHILDHGTIYAVDPCRRFCRRYGMIHANIFHSQTNFKAVYLEIDGVK